MIVNYSLPLSSDFVPKVLTPLLTSESHNPTRKWTLQGFGMLRLHIPSAEASSWPIALPPGLSSSDIRLNLWHHDFTVPGVSDIHTHPWHFTSFILTGCLFNSVYRESLTGAFLLSSPHNRYPIIPGPNGGLSQDSPPTPVELYIYHQAALRPGDSYTQNHDEIHQTDFIDGTVTLNFRTRCGPDEALVYIPQDQEWVSAKPRAATPDEIRVFCLSTLLQLTSLRGWGIIGGESGECRGE